MIDSLFILSGSGSYVCERHFRGGTTARMVCEPFMEKLRSCERVEEIPGILASNRRHVLIHIYRDKMMYLAVVTQEEAPMAVFELLERVHTVLSRYLGEVNEDTLRQQFSIVYLLLDEMIDSGLPFTTEPNSLEAIIAPPSALGKLTKAVSGTNTQVLSDVAPANGQDGALASLTSALGGTSQAQIGSATSETWWRRQNVVYASNEIYVDILESVDCICNGSGNIIAGGINGTILVNSKLSGLPEVLLTLRNPGVMQNVSFHPCVRLHRFDRDRALSFIPPDGEFKLASYWIPDTTLNLPVNVSTSISYHAEHARIQIEANPKLAITMQNKQMLIDRCSVRVRVPSSIVSANLSSQGGHVRFEDKTKTVVWSLGKLSEQDNKLEGTLIYASDPKAAGKPIIPAEEKSTAQVAFVIKGWAISGIKLDSCEVSSISYTPYKASRYTTQSGKMDFRIA